MSVSWDEVRTATATRTLRAYLEAHVPCAHWAAAADDERNFSLLHWATREGETGAVTALLRQGVPVNVRDADLWTPAHAAAHFAQPHVLELLCAAGADLRATNSSGKTPLDMVLVLRARDGEACARVLVANGARLRRPSRATPALRAFERGVLRCRSAVVAMLRVKHVGRLARWDKYLLVHLAVCVWCTRYATSDWSE